MIRRSRIFIAGAIGILGGFGMLVAPAWVLTPLSLGICFYCLWTARNTKEAVVCGTLYGTITAGAGLLALWEIVPPALGDSLLPTLLSAAFLWSIPTLTLGLTTAPIAYLVFLTRENIFAPFIAVLAWCVNEVLRMWAWTLVSYGKGAVFEPHLTITGLAYSLADSEVTLQFARLGGFFALTILLGIMSVTIASFICWYTQKKSGMQALLLLAVLICALTLPSTLPQEETRNRTELTVALFSSDTLHNTEVRPVPTTTPDIVLFPEDKILSQFPLETRTQYEKWRSENKELLTVRSQLTASEDGERHVSVIYETSDGAILGEQEKRFLMPQGEYIPFLYSLIFKHIPRVSIPHIKDDATATYGTSLVSVPVRGYQAGTLLCSEVFSPFLYRSLVEKHGATLLFNLGDPMWFRGSRLLFTKTLQVAKVHAVQNNVYMLFAQNASPSFAINPKGEVIAQTPWDTQGVLMVHIPQH